MAWPPPQHAPDTVAPDREQASPDDEFSERIESVIWHTFRTASVSQVTAATREIRQAAIRYAEHWAQQHPRRQLPRA